MEKIPTYRILAGIITAVLIICGTAGPGQTHAQERDTSRIITLGNDDWEPWPPHSYYHNWQHIEPMVTELKDGSRFGWLAADYLVVIDGRILELWREYGQVRTLAATLLIRRGSAPRLMLHPWRGPHILYWQDRTTLAALYPVDYYQFGSAVISTRADEDGPLWVDVARSGPVVVFSTGFDIVTATYFGKGYQTYAFDGEDNLQLGVDNEGDAVVAYEDHNNLFVQQYREGRGWQRTELKDYRRRSYWSLVPGTGGLVLEYESKSGMEAMELEDSAVRRPWWQ